jgi:hypothetical protein
MFVNCWMCGQKVDKDETILAQFAADMHRVCADRDDCHDYVKGSDFDIPEDTPYLEEPWWAYR